MNTETRFENMTCREIFSNETGVSPNQKSLKNLISKSVTAWLPVMTK